MLEVTLVHQVQISNIHPRGKPRSTPTRTIQRRYTELRYKNGKSDTITRLSSGTYKISVIEHLIIDGSLARNTVERRAVEPKKVFFVPKTSYKSKNLTSERLTYLIHISARDIKFWRAAYNHMYSREAFNEFVDTRMIAEKLF